MSVGRVRKMDFGKIWKLSTNGSWDGLWAPWGRVYTLCFSGHRVGTMPEWLALCKWFSLHSIFQLMSR